MRFIKENPALAAGIGLPVLLVIFFSLAAMIPKWTVETPKYDAIFSLQEYKCNNSAEVRFKSVDGSIKAEYNYPKKENNYGNCPYNQRLYRFNAKTLVTREVTFNIPSSNEDNSNWQELDIPELKTLKVDNNPVAPDGYKFMNKGDYYSGGFFPFWSGYNHRNGVAIAKNGRVVDLSPFSKERYYSYDTVNFLGWVVPGGAVNE